MTACMMRHPVHWLRAFSVVLASFCMVGVASAQSAPATTEEVIALLKQAQEAARATDYAGVFSYQENGAMQSSRITHVVDGTGERERLEVLDGKPREFIRHNDTLYCLIPEKQLVLVEEARTDRFPGMFLGDTGHLMGHYDFMRDTHPSRVAGRECTVVHVNPKTPDRYGYKFCVDRETNLLVKAQTVNGLTIVDEIAFTMLQVGEKVSPEHLHSSWNTGNWKQVEIATHNIDASQLGWRIHTPPGFQFATQISRPMKSGEAVKHLVLSDGLAAISVFIEPFEAARTTRSLSKGARKNGAINVFATRIGDYWLTALGAVPVATLQAVAEQTQFIAPAGGQQ